MKRKVVSQGNNARTISLPISWVKEHNIVPGDYVRVTPKTKYLLVSTDEFSKLNAITIDMPHSDVTSIRIYLYYVYRSGYEKITVNTQSAKQLKTIKSVFADFFEGYDLLEESKDSATFIYVRPAFSEDATIIENKMYSLMSITLQDFIKDLKENSIDPKEYKEKQFIMHRYENFCKRCMQLDHLDTPVPGLQWKLYDMLSLMQHEFRHWANALDGQLPNEVDSIINILERIADNYQRTVQAYKNNDVDTLVTCADEITHMRNDEIVQKLRTSSGLQTVSLFYLGQIARFTRFLSVPMISLVLHSHAQ